MAARSHISALEENVEQNIRRSCHRIAADFERSLPFRFQMYRLTVRQDCAEILKCRIASHEQSEFVGIGIRDAVVGFCDEEGAVGEFSRHEISPVERGGFKRALHGGCAGAADGIPLLIEIEHDGMGPVAVSEGNLGVTVPDGVVAKPDRNIELADQSPISDFPYCSGAEFHHSRLQFGTAVDEIAGFGGILRTAGEQSARNIHGFERSIVCFPCVVEGRECFVFPFQELPEFEIKQSVFLFTDLCCFEIRPENASFLLVAELDADQLGILFQFCSRVGVYGIQNGFGIFAETGFGFFCQEKESDPARMRVRTCTAHVIVKRDIEIASLFFEFRDHEPVPIASLLCSVPAVGFNMKAEMIHAECAEGSGVFPGKLFKFSAVHCGGVFEESTVPFPVGHIGIESAEGGVRSKETDRFSGMFFKNGASLGIQDQAAELSGRSRYG